MPLKGPLKKDDLLCRLGVRRCGERSTEAAHRSMAPEVKQACVLKRTVSLKAVWAFFFIAALQPAALRAAGESLSYTMAVPPAKGAVMPWGRDPFLLPTATEPAGPALRLKAIFFNAENPSAIIDNMIVYRGSEIKGQKVIDIGRTHVILQGEYGRVRLDLSGTTEPRDAAK